MSVPIYLPTSRSETKDEVTHFPVNYKCLGAKSFENVISPAGRNFRKIANINPQEEKRVIPNCKN